MRDYENLTHRGQFQRIGRLARTVLREYDLSPDARLTPLHHGENTTFRVDDPVSGRRYCLRIHRPGYQSIDAIRSELQFLDIITRETDLIVPRPVATRDGEPLAFAETDGVPGRRAVVLFDWIAGRFPKQLTLATVARSGVTLARLHEFAQSFVPPPGFIRPVVYTEYRGRTLGESLDVSAIPIEGKVRAAIEHAHERATAVRTALRRTPDVYGLIHADFHRGNFIVRLGGVIAPIDFDDCGWGHYLQDLAAPIMQYTARPENAPRAEAFLRGYRTIRPFSREEEALLPYFALLRRTWMLQWVIDRWDSPTLRGLLSSSIDRTTLAAQALG